MTSITDICKKNSATKPIFRNNFWNQYWRKVFSLKKNLLKQVTIKSCVFIAQFQSDVSDFLSVPIWSNSVRDFQVFFKRVTQGQFVSGSFNIAVTCLQLIRVRKWADSQLDVDSAEYRSTNKITRLSSLVTFKIK